MKASAVLAAFLISLAPLVSAAADPDLSGLPPEAQAAARFLPACTDPTMAELFKNTFNGTPNVRAFRLKAVLVDDPAEVAPDSVLAKRLDAQVPRPMEGASLRYCKARLKLNSAETVPEIFRIDVRPDGHTPVVGAHLTDALFDDPALSQSSPGRSPRSAAPLIINPATTAPPPTTGPGVVTVTPLATTSSSPRQVAANSSPGTLPSRTVLCIAESDYISRQQDMATPSPTHKIGASCFFLEDSTGFTSTGTERTTMAQVRLADGPHAGAVAWTERALISP